MRLEWMVGWVLMAGCDALGPDCARPLTDDVPRSFSDSDVFTECFVVSVCDDGAFD